MKKLVAIFAIWLAALALLTLGVTVWAFPTGAPMLMGAAVVSNVTPPVLDGLPAPAFAYSLRRLLSSWHGSAVNVRRAVGSPATTDIGFSASGDFDAATFNTFCSGTSCFVTTWYDQSGNGLNCSQATAANQPQVTLNSLGGRASLQTTGAAGGMYCTIATNASLDFTGVGHTVLYELQYTAITDGGGTAGGRGDSLEVVSHYNPTGFYPGWASDAGDTGRAGSTFVHTANNSTQTNGGAFGQLTAINDGNPHFAGWSFASGTVVFYQDANQYTSTTAFVTPTTTGQQTTMLAANDVPIDAFFAGNFAETYGWGSTLPGATISAVASNAKTYYTPAGGGGGGGGGGSIVCANGQTPYSGSVPAVAQNAGFTTCALNMDFTNSFWSSQSNFVDCNDTNPNLILRNSFSANNCNIHQVTDPDTGDTVLRLQWLTSYGNTKGSGGNPDNRIQEYQTWKHTGQPYLAFPNMYFEVVSRIDLASLSTQPSCCGPESMFFCQIYNGSGGVQDRGIAALEPDPYELYGGPSGGTGNVGGKGFGDAGAGLPGCGGISTQSWHWFSYETNNLPSGWSPVNYHKYGLLITSDGSSNQRICFFVDDVLMGNESATPGCASFSSPASYTDRWYLLLDLETASQTSGYPSGCASTSSCVAANVNQQLYYKYARIFTCSNWMAAGGVPGNASNMCNGGSLHNSTGGNDPWYWH